MRGTILRNIVLICMNVVLKKNVMLRRGTGS